MATTTFTSNLKLRISSDLTADSKFNLQKLDSLGSIYQIDTNQVAKVRSQTNITMQPNDPDIGGTGSGGTISIGTVDQPADTVSINATTFSLSGSFSNSSAITSSTGIGVTNGNNTLLLAPSGSLSSNVTLTLPTDTGTVNQVLTTDGTGVLSWTTVAGANLGQEGTATWLAASGSSITVTHGFNSRNVMVEVIDPSDDYATVQMDTVKRPNDNQVSLTASSAPSVSWTILMKEIG